MESAIPHWTEPHEDMAMGGGRKPKSKPAGGVKKPTDFDTHPLMLRDYWDRRISAGDLAMVVYDKRWCVAWKREGK